MRITPGMVAATTLRNIQQNFERLEELQNQLTSGSRIRKPSDDPVNVARALTFREGIDQTSQYLSNIDQATAWLNTTDSTLDAVGALLQRARELAVQGSNGALSGQDRAAIQAEAAQLEDQAFALSSAKYGAYYLFAGSNSSSPAFARAGVPGAYTYTYQGNAAASDQVLREVSPGVTMAVNVRGQTLFPAVFQALAALQSGLAAGATSTIQASIGQIDTALDGVLGARAQVGAKANRLEFLKGRLDDVKVNLTRLLSQVQDVDMAEAITNFSVQENVYKASLQAAGRALQPSLLDYLR